MGEGILTRRSGGSANIVSARGYQLLADIEVTGSARTRVDFNGLNLGKGDEVLLVSNVVNSSASTSAYYLFANNNIVQTNYYAQILQANSTNIVGGRYNESDMLQAVTLKNSFCISNIKLTSNGYVVMQSNSNRDYNGTLIFLENWYATTTWTTDKITALTIQSSVTNAIGIGSRFQLYKTNGTVVRTWDTV